MKRTRYLPSTFGRGRKAAATAIATALLAALVSACGSDSNSGGGEDAVLRIVQAPDPAWHWMQDQGIVDEMEEEWGITTETTETFDSAPIFAGGHADVIQNGTYDLPELNSKGIDTVTFGAWNRAKDLWVAPPDSNAETLEDLPEGAKIGAFSNSGTTALWAALLKPELDGEDFRESDRWDFVVAATEQLPKLVMDGELDAAIVDPQLTVTLLAAGKLHAMYDGAPLAKYFAAETGGPPALDTNLLTTTADFYENNERETRFYLALWQRAIEEWKEHRTQIIQAYPEEFSITQPSDVQAFEDYLDSEFDWFEPQATLTQEFIDAQGEVYDLLKSVGEMDSDAEDPTFVELKVGQP